MSNIIKFDVAHMYFICFHNVKFTKMVIGGCGGIMNEQIERPKILQQHKKCFFGVCDNDKTAIHDKRHIKNVEVIKL